MADNFVAEAFTLLAIGLVVIALRWISRLLTVGFSKLAADDYLMIIAGVCHPICSAILVHHCPSCD